MLDAGQAGRRKVPISESDTCRCWAGVVARHLTSSTVKHWSEASDLGPRDMGKALTVATIASMEGS
jgi:hypothetical protein